jgi:ribosomal peptide maturation radical SAM protein 1
VTDEAGCDVLFVSMPMVSIERPSLGLGELTACLKQAGLSVRSRYANIMFLDYVGLEDYALLNLPRIEDSLTDWLFAGVAFPYFAPDHAHYLRRLRERNTRYADKLDAAGDARLLALRGAMAGFVDWVVDSILAERPRIVGASSTFQQHVASLALLRRLRERAPDIVTMMGGANCETMMGRTTHRHFPWVDFVVSGEADGLIAPLCRAVLEHGRDLPADALPYGVLAPVHRIAGYPVTPAGDGVPRAQTDDMTTVPAPDYDDYFAELSRSLFRHRVRPGIPFESARGCWWGERRHCTFCGLNGGGMAFRAKPAGQVLGELDALAARYNASGFEAVDNIMASDYLDTLAPALTDSARGYALFYETKANLRPADVARLAAAGIRWIQPGIENLHTEVLKLMRKGVTGWNNVRLLRSARQHGVRISWSLLTGFPGEEDSWYHEMADWLPALAHFQPGGIVKLRYDRYSPYFNEAAQYGLDLIPSELYPFVYPLDDDALADQVYFFEDRNDTDRRVNLSVGGTPVRPGIARVREAALAWRDLWASGSPPTLEIEAAPGGWRIRDTRPVATAGERLLGDDEATLLFATEDAPPLHRLRENPACRDWSAARFDAALATLRSHRYVLDIDGRCIGLALRAPVAALPLGHQFPGGLFDASLPPRPARAEAAE